MTPTALKVTVQKAPQEWLKAAPSPTKAVDMEHAWDACQFALVEVPPDKRDASWIATSSPRFAVH